jgi:hypothetical protein
MFFKVDGMKVRVRYLKKRLDSRGVVIVSFLMRLKQEKKYAHKGLFHILMRLKHEKNYAHCWVRSPYLYFILLTRFTHNFEPFSSIGFIF